MFTQIKKEEAHILNSVNLKDISAIDWKAIDIQRSTFILADDCGPEFLRWPGYVFSDLKAVEAYLKIRKDFINQKIYTPSHGNLSKNNNHILIGIRPSHAMPNQRNLQGYPAWFLGESSSILHRLLEEANIFPYVGNIYNQPSQPFNKNFTFILKEIAIIMYIYKFIYGFSEINLIFMGNYDEYPVFTHQLKTHKIYKKIGLQVNTASIYHPSYFLRSGLNEQKFEIWKYQLIQKSRII